MKDIILALYISAIFFPSAALAQAFGISMGENPAALNNHEEIQNGVHTVSAPNPHSEFESYIVKASDSHGVCMVRGIGKDHTNDRFGQSVRQSFQALEAVLESNYGLFLKNDFLRSGALWDGSEEWVMAIRQNERVYQSVWDNDEKSELPANIQSIILAVNATSSSSSWVVLQYTFINHDDCQDELTQIEASGL